MRPSRHKPRTLHYLCLEAMAEGDASHAHVMGIVEGLERRDWIVRVFRPRRRRHRSVARRLLDASWTQLRLLAAGSSDVLYVRGHPLAAPAVLIRGALSGRVVWEANGGAGDILSSWPWLRPILPLINILNRVQLRATDLVIGVTPEIAASARLSGARQTAVVPNGADVEFFRPLPRDAGDQPLYVAFVGKLATWQGLDSLLAAVVHELWPQDVALVVAGDGPMASHIAGVANESDRVRYLGRIPHEAVRSVVGGAMAAVAPMSAGQRATTGVVPLKLFEAMACGVPVVVTNLPGQAGIVEGERCGLVVEPDQPAELARAVARLRDDAELRRAMGNAGRAAAEARYSWDASAATTHQLLEDLLA